MYKGGGGCNLVIKFARFMNQSLNNRVLNALILRIIHFILPLT